MHQRGREAPVAIGEAFLTHGAEAGAVDNAESRWLTLCVPAEAIAPRVPDIESHVARPIGRHNGALQLLTGYTTVLHDPALMATPESRHLAVSHVYDLLALTLGATRDAAEAARAGGVRAARLHAIKQDVLQNLSADLSAAAVAARHRLQPRYLQRLFEEDGTTFTAYVLRQRLAQARRMLLDPRFAHLKISTVAADVGLGNRSHFNESFRRRYGASPSDTRAQSRHIA